MKRIYSSLRPPIEQKSYVDWITKCNQKISVSSRGLIAFTSSFCLHQNCPTSTSYHVYVADINVPYQPYTVVDSAYDFTIVEWDPSGTKLLVCDVRGSATIYTSRDYLVSDWKLYFQQVFAAETFISAAWYHSGIVSTINVANQNLKNPSNHLEYTEKVQQTKFGASLRLFGGKSAEGCILVSQTGLVCCLTLIAGGSVDVVTESLSHLRNRIEVADICHHKDGSFIIGTSSGSVNSTISFYQVYLQTRNLTIEEVDAFSGSENGRRVNVLCKQFNSFHLNIAAQILSERENSLPFERVAHIKFVTKDSPDDVLVEVSGQNLSLIELWELEPKKKVSIHPAILEQKLKQNQEVDVKPNLNSTTGKVIVDETTNNQQGESVVAQSKEWIFKGNSINEKELVTIQTPKFKIFGPNKQPNIILLVFKDSTISCIKQEDLQPIHESLDLYTPPLRNSNIHNNNNHHGRLDGSDNNSLHYKVFPDHRNNIKQAKLSTNNLLNSKQSYKTTYITDIQVTGNQTVFIAIDSLSQIHAVELSPLITCQDSKDQKTYLQYLLEYCLITGNDWWDVLICAKQDSIEEICEKFHDAYERQPKHIQRKYFNRQLMIRASLYRCLNNVSSLCKSSDCHTMIMLNSIASTLKSIIRSQDQDSPAEYLTNFLKSQGTQPNYFNLNNVISKLNEKEFYIEINLIQCLQPLSQWIIDLATFLVVSVPQRSRLKTLLPGSGLATNKEALEIIRELLVIIKIWGLQNESSMPTVYKLEPLDVFGILFRLISILYTTLGQNNELDEGFIEECIQLSNGISIAEFVFLLDSIGVASPLLHHRHLQQQQQQQLTSPTISGNDSSYLTLEFFKQPSLPERVNLPQVDGAINMKGQRKIDVVRNISLGARPMSNLKHCTRCKSVSLIKPAFQTTRSWEQRWISSCVCGGSWAQSDSASVNAGYGAPWSSYQNSNISTTVSSSVYNNHNNHQLVR